MQTPSGFPWREGQARLRSRNRLFNSFCFPLFFSSSLGSLALARNPRVSFHPLGFRKRAWKSAPLSTAGLSSLRSPAEAPARPGRPLGGSNPAPLLIKSAFRLAVSASLDPGGFAPFCLSLAWVCSFPDWEGKEPPTTAGSLSVPMHPEACLGS